jgi:DNA-binding beta-propeller fold protein YncE
VDPSSADVNPIALAGEPASIAVGPGSGSVYVLDATTNAIVKIEPSDGTEIGRVPVRDLSVGISSGLRPDALWLRPRMVVSTIDQRVYVIEPEAATLALAPPEI